MTIVGLGCDYGGCAIGLVDLTVLVTCLWVNLVVMGIFGDSGYFAVVDLGMGFLIWVLVFFGCGYLVGWWGVVLW